MHLTLTSACHSVFYYIVYFCFFLNKIFVFMYLVTVFVLIMEVIIDDDEDCCTEFCMCTLAAAAAAVMENEHWMLASVTWPIAVVL